MSDSKLNGITLRVDNSFSNIEGLNLEQFSKLREELSYLVSKESYFYGGFGPQKRYLLDKKGFFPSGLLYVVRMFLKTIRHSVIDKRLIPKVPHKIFSLKLEYSPYTEQKEAVEAAVRAKQGTIRAPTGFGKATVIAMLIDKLQLKTLVVVPNLSLKNQLENSLKGCFGSLKNIVVENIDSANLDKDHRFDVLIIDEAHHSAAKTYRHLNKNRWNSVYYRFNLTATPFRSDEEEQLLMEGITGPVIYSVSYKKAVDKGYIVPLQAYYVELPKKSVEGSSWPQVYKELVVDNEYRNLIIKKLLGKLDRLNISTLCLVKEIRHGENLAPFPFINGQDEESRTLLDDFNSRQINILIGTTGVVGEGVDTKPCEFVIIAGLGKSKNSLMQAFGRALRIYKGKVSAKVVIILDKSHKFTKSHFKTQCGVLKEEYSIIPKKIDL